MVQDLRTEAERVCLECEKLQNKSIWREARQEVLVEKSKYELCRAMLTQQEEECFEVDDTMKKIDNEWKLDTKEEVYEEECYNEHDAESESEDDRDFVCGMFDSWIHYVHYVRWELNKD